MQSSTHQGHTHANLVSTPAALSRTAIRILLLVVHRGLHRAPAKLRQSAEAQQASQGLYRADEFFNRGYDPRRHEEELRHLSDALAILAQQYSGDPVTLFLYAVRDLPFRSRKASAAVPLHQK
jgi:hypothetical protein